MKIIAEDILTKKLLHEIRKYASLGVKVYLWGESGAGKDTFALYIHEASGRKGAFLKVGAYSISPALAESQFFGHLEGAFSGAEKAREGFLERANEGTLYLDLLDSLPMDVQIKIFDALETGRFIPLGGTEERNSSFLLVASGQLPLEEAASRGKIHPKFVHLFPVCVRIPPLRERKGDIIPLAEYFAMGRIKISRRKALVSYPWPGNVRQLRNFIEREISLGKKETGEPAMDFSWESSPDVIPLREMERIYVRKVLERFGGNKTRAAKALGITRKTLRRILKG